MTKWLDKVTSYDVARRHAGLRQHRRVDRPARRADPARGDHVVGHDRNAVDHPEGQGRRDLHDEVWRQFLFQSSGASRQPSEVDPVVDVIWPNHASGKLGHHLRMAAMLKREFTGGDESRFHALYSDAICTDLMFLASKMRAAASRGELDRLEIDPKLLARKDEFIAMQASDHRRWRNSSRA